MCEFKFKFERGVMLVNTFSEINPQIKFIKIKCMAMCDNRQTKNPV